MLNDSASPRNELQRLWEWRNLSETQEVLKYLRDKAVVAQAQVNKSPLTFNINGTVPPLDMINSLRDRFAGNREGFLELDRLLTQREEELSVQIKEIDAIKS